MSPTLTLIVAAIGLAIPPLSALISKEHWDASITGLITGGLSVVDGVATEAVGAAAQHAPYNLTQALLGAGAAWASGVLLTQRGILSGTLLEDRLRAVGSRKQEPEDPTFGLDPNEDDEPDGHHEAPDDSTDSDDDTSTDEDDSSVVAGGVTAT